MPQSSLNDNFYSDSHYVVQINYGKCDMNTRVQKWGNSLGLRIPKHLAELSSIEEGSVVDISLNDGMLVIRLIDKTTLELSALVEGVTEKNIHRDSFLDISGRREVHERNQ